MTDARRHGSALERARWLAEVAEALEAARAIFARLDPAVGPDAATAALDHHLAKAIAEANALRRGAWPKRSVAPKRTHFRPGRPRPPA